MADVPQSKSPRRPRFRRAAQPSAFRLTDGDREIVRLVAEHRFLRSTQIASLVGRSLDRTNDRLCRLFHAGYVDRPRAQLDHYPTAGSAPMVYAITDAGMKLLARQTGNGDWQRKNREAGRPFIEHQLGVTEFYVSLQLAVRNRQDVQIIAPEELLRSFPEATRAMRNPISMRATVSVVDREYPVAVVPDLYFGLRFRDGSRRCFLVEIDRGTMPISRSDLSQSSFERKARGYLAAYAERLHERQFGWKAYRVLVVTTDAQRLRSMTDALRQTAPASPPGAALFLFAISDQVREANPLSAQWLDGIGRDTSII